MANKVVYLFESYPESSDVQQIETAFNASQWGWCRSQLHDKDVYEEGHEKAGQLKKPHYHWLVGFAKSAPDYKTFKNHVQSLGCVVPPANKCIEKHVADRVLYFSHKSQNAQKQGKHLYNDPVFGDYWCIDDYVTYTQQRAEKQAVKGDEISEILRIMNKEKVYDTRHVSEFLLENRPELLATYASKAYYFNQYAAGIVTTDKRVAELEEQIHQLELQLSHAYDMQEDEEAQAFRLCQNLRTYYERITGEPVAFSDLSLKTAEQLVLTLLERG